MKQAYLMAFCWVPFALYGGGCSSSATPDLGCSLDPACYVVSPSGQCSIDRDSLCVDGSWQCSAHGTLGSGCAPDGAIVPPPIDAGGCPLDKLTPPLACTSDATCAPYGGTCEFTALNGPGQCACGGGRSDGGIPPDGGCTGSACADGGGLCTLPWRPAIPCTTDAPCAAYNGAACNGTQCVCVLPRCTAGAQTIPCNGPNDDTTCTPYGGACIGNAGTTCGCPPPPPVGLMETPSRTGLR